MGKLLSRLCRAGRQAGVFFAICGFVALLAIGLSGATALLDGPQLRGRIVQAFDSGALVPAGYLGEDERRGRYSVNDCLTLQTLVLAGGDWRNVGIRSRVLDAPDRSVCQALRDYVDGSLPAATPTYDYARYFFTAKALVGPALMVFPLDGIRQFLRIVIYGLLMGVLAVAAVRVVTPGSDRRLLAATLLVVPLGWLTLYDLRYYAPLLSHSFSEIVLAGYMVYALCASSRPRPGIPWSVVWLGALTACFELLTGPALLAAGLAVLVDFAQDPARPHPLRRALGVWCATALAILATLLVLQLAVFADGGMDALRQFFWHLLLRMDLHLLLGLPMEANWKIAENLRSYSLHDVGTALFRHLPMLTHSSRRVANSVFVGSMLVLAWAAIVGISQRPRRPVLVYVAVALSLAAWSAAFSNHTVVHAWAMVRMAVLLPVCATMSLVYLYGGHVPAAARQLRPWLSRRRTPGNARSRN